MTHNSLVNELLLRLCEDVAVRHQQAGRGVDMHCKIWTYFKPHFPDQVNYISDSNI